MVSRWLSHLCWHLRMESRSSQIPSEFLSIQDFHIGCHAIWTKRSDVCSFCSCAENRASLKHPELRGLVCALEERAVFEGICLTSLGHVQLDRVLAQVQFAWTIMFIEHSTVWVTLSERRPCQTKWTSLCPVNSHHLQSSWFQDRRREMCP